MKQIFFQFVAIIFNLTCNSQNYFSNRFEYGQPGLWSAAGSILILSDGYIFGGGNGSPWNLPWHRLGFFKADVNGNKIFSKSYGDSTSEYFIGDPGSIIRYNDTLIIVSGSKNTNTSNWVHQEGLLYFLNNDFDTLFVKHFGEKSLPIDTEYLFRQLKKINSNKIIVVGDKKPYGLAEKILLIETDNSGNEIWEKTYGYGYYYQGHSVICTNDGGFAIGGYTWHPTSSYDTGDPVLVKTDSAGNQQWMLILGSLLRDTQAMVCNSLDGAIIVGTSYCDSMSGDITFRRINIIKIDYNENILWDKKYGKSEYGLELSNIRENPDGTFIATGITPRFFPTHYKYVGWIFKIDSNGDSLWYREYEICEGEASYNWLYDVVQTPDNGFLACGVVYPHPPDTGSQDGWILKVDSMGCESPGNCWVGIKPESNPVTYSVMKIYPNPADKYLSIEFPECLVIPSGSRKFSSGTIYHQWSSTTLEIFDLYGKKIDTREIPKAQTRLEMDVSDWHPGMYLFRLVYNNHTVADTKVIIQ